MVTPHATDTTISQNANMFSSPSTYIKISQCALCHIFTTCLSPIKRSEWKARRISMEGVKVVVYPAQQWFRSILIFSGRHSENRYAQVRGGGISPIFILIFPAPRKKYGISQRLTCVFGKEVWEKHPLSCAYLFCGKISMDSEEHTRPTMQPASKMTF